MIGEIYINDFNEYNLAATYFKNIIDNYPITLNEVKKSIFTLAYIYSNYLNYYTQSINLYEKFIDLYPSDELIESIYYELDLLSNHRRTIDSLINTSK